MAFAPCNTLGREEYDFALRSENRYVLHPLGLKRRRVCTIVKSLEDDYTVKGRKGQKNTACRVCESIRLGVLRAQQRLVPELYCRSLLAKLRHRARVQGVPFDLKPGNLYQQWLGQQGLCYYTAEPLNLAVHTASRLSPHIDSPSVDRLVPHDGYVRSNVVWCRWGVNRAKSDLTATQFIEMCRVVAGRFT